MRQVLAESPRALKSTVISRSAARTATGIHIGKTATKIGGIIGAAIPVGSIVAAEVVAVEWLVACGSWKFVSFQIVVSDMRSVGEKVDDSLPGQAPKYGATVRPFATEVDCMTDGRDGRRTL